MIVGIGNIARVGKDTAAQALCRDLGFRRVAFADKLKELAFHADPMIFANSMTNVGIGSGHLRKVVISNGWERAKDSYPEARKFLQNLGVAAREVFGPDFWVNQAVAGIRPDERVVIPDVRFPEEFEAIRSMGGKLIRLTRPGCVPIGGHISETALSDMDLWDATIDNGGSMIELEQKVTELVRNWLTKDAQRASEQEADPVETRVVR